MSTINLDTTNGYAFISYSTKNKISAHAMRDLLRDNGIKTWMAPGDIPVGSKYAQVINQAIKECSCFILLLSKEAQNSVWVAKEVERAINYRKHIIPVQIDKVALNDEFELYISTDQVVTIRRIDKQSKEVQKMLNTVASFTGTITPLPSQYSAGVSTEESKGNTIENRCSTEKKNKPLNLLGKIHSLFRKSTDSVSQAMQMVSNGMLDESSDILYKIWTQYYNRIQNNAVMTESDWIKYADVCIFLSVIYWICGDKPHYKEFVRYEEVICEKYAIAENKKVNDYIAVNYFNDTREKIGIADAVGTNKYNEHRLVCEIEIYKKLFEFAPQEYYEVLSSRMLRYGIVLAQTFRYKEAISVYESLLKYQKTYMTYIISNEGLIDNSINIERERVKARLENVKKEVEKGSKAVVKN